MTLVGDERSSPSHDGMASATCCLEGSIVVDEDQKDGPEIHNEKEPTLLEDKVQKN